MVCGVSVSYEDKFHCNGVMSLFVLHDRLVCVRANNVRLRGQLRSMPPQNTIPLSVVLHFSRMYQLRLVELVSDPPPPPPPSPIVTTEPVTIL